jgi:hypothetical protein
VDPLNEGVGATDRLGIGAAVCDAITRRTSWRLEKRHGDGAMYEGGVEAFKRDVKPYEVLEFEGNLLTNVGGGAIWDLVTGAGVVTAFDAGNAYLGVGDSATAADPAQTDLQAGPNKIRKGMNATYPDFTDGVIIFQADFTGAEGTFTWNEVGTFNAAAAGEMLNRKVQALGVKGAGATWTLTETITLS